MKSVGNWFKGDRVIWIVYFFLCAISLIEVYSAASTLTYKTGDFWSPLIKQAAFLGGGTFLVVFIHLIPCRMFKVVPVVLLPIFAIVLPLTMLFGESENNASRWIDMGFFQFQPSEFAKMAVVMAVAQLLSVFQREDGADKRAFTCILIITVFFCLMILPENFSTAALLLGVVVIMMFVGRVSLLQLGKLFGTLALTALIAVASIKYLSSVTDISKIPLMHRVETWTNRIDRFLDNKNEIDFDHPEKYNIEDNAQEAHAHIAVCTGKLIGCMPGNSVERDFLSQAFSDFIYAIIIEEMGLVGGVFVIFLYIILLFRAGRIASMCERNYPAFLVLGLALMMVTQAMFNMAVAVGFFPVTGQPLPLISRGGSSLLMYSICIGMILSVSRYARRAKNPTVTYLGTETNDIIRDEDTRASDYKAPQD